MITLNKEINILYNIDERINDPKLISELFHIKLSEVKNIFNKLEKKGLIKIERKDNNIYQAILTENGRSYLKKYSEYLNEDWK